MTPPIEKEILLRQMPEVEFSRHCSFCLKPFQEGQQQREHWLCDHKLHQICQERFDLMNRHCIACDPEKTIKMRLSKEELERTGNTTMGWSVMKILEILNLEKRIPVEQDMTLDPLPLPEGIKTIQLAQLRIDFPEFF